MVSLSFFLGIVTSWVLGGSYLVAWWYWPRFDNWCTAQYKNHQAHRFDHFDQE